MENKEILVIEKLDIISLIYFSMYSRRFKEAFYLSEGRLVSLPLIKSFISKSKLKRLRFKDFPGSYFDVQKEAVTNANDRFYDSHRENNVFVDFLLKFKDNELVEVALRHVLLDYTVRRVTTCVFLRKIIESHKAFVTFIPADSIDFFPFISGSYVPLRSAYAVPNIVKILNKLKELLNRWSFFFYATGYVLRLSIRRGVAFKSGEPKKFLIGFDTFINADIWRYPYFDTFLYDEEPFKPDKILRVVRHEVKDEKTKRYFEDNGCPYAEFGRVKIPAAYFIKRIVLDFYPKAIACGFRNLFSHSGTTIFMLPSIWIANLIIANEIFYSHYNVKVFIARDEYGATHIIRTLILNEKGGKTVGFMHGDNNHPHPSLAYVCMDYFCINGAFYKKRHKKSLRYCKKVEIIGAGIYGLDRTYKYMLKNRIPGKYKNLKEKYRIVTVFGSSFDPDIHLTEELTLYFYRKALALLEMYDDIFIVIKPKYDEFERENFRAIVSQAEGRVAVEKDLSTYEIIPISDLMICITTTTVGIEGIMAGKRVLYFEMTNYQDHPYRKYDKRLVSFTDEEFYKNIDWVLKGNYISDEKLRYITERHGYKFDGHIVDRLRDVVLEALAHVD